MKQKTYLTYAEAIAAVKAGEKVRCNVWIHAWVDLLNGVPTFHRGYDEVTLPMPDELPAHIVFRDKINYEVIQSPQ